MPVLKSIWKYFCPVGNGRDILTQVQAFCPNAKLVDLNDTFFGGSLVYANPPLDTAPGIEGSFRVGDDTLSINESAAWLLDRLRKPVPFVDQYSPTGGKPPVLKYSDIGNGIVQLYWGV
jgi:hypothetical protein